jgi:DNA topoisomerase VI subunit B
VVLKELVDNALDACEEAGIAPEVAVRVGAHGITVIDNGPGIPPAVIENILDFSVRVSSREAYISPCRGAQGNALKTIIAMPFAPDAKPARSRLMPRAFDTRSPSPSIRSASSRLSGTNAERDLQKAAPT